MKYLLCIILFSITNNVQCQERTESTKELCHEVFKCLVEAKNSAPKLFLQDFIIYVDIRRTNGSNQVKNIFGEMSHDMRPYLEEAVYCFEKSHANLDAFSFIFYHVYNDTYEFHNALEPIKIFREKHQLSDDVCDIYLESNKPIK